jgi:hypothetical protein
MLFNHNRKRANVWLKIFGLFVLLSMLLFTLGPILK